MRLVQAVLCLLLLAQLVSKSEQIGVNTGPYEMEVKHVYACQDQESNKINLEMSMYLGKEPGPKYRKRLHRGSFTFSFTEDEMSRLEIQALFYQKKTNDFLLMYNYLENYCESMLTIAPDTYRDVRVAYGIPPEGCFIPQGNYTFNDWEIIFNLPTPMLEYGTYKITIKIILDKVVFVCFEGIVVVKRKY